MKDKGDVLMYYFSVLAIFKNETINLKEWIDHYFWQGAEHIYLIDNDSSDNPLAILEPYIAEGKITYFFLPEKWKQLEYYRLVFNQIKEKNETHWLCITDLDEFWYSPKSILADELKNLEKYDAIHSNWLMFGSDGHIKHPLSLRKHITKRERKHSKLTKYIIKVAKIDAGDFDIHKVRVKNSKTVNDKIRLNHYPIQSLEFFQKVKMKRGDADSKNSEHVRDMNYFYN